MTDELTIRDFLEADGVESWRVVSDGAYAFYATASFEASVRFVTKSAEQFGLTTIDLELAREVERTATEHGLAADPSAIQSLLIIPGAPDPAAIMPFWRAVLGYEPRMDSPEEDLVDPHDRDAAFWLEEMGEPRADGKGAIHIAVWVPEEEAHARLEAAIAAGGKVVFDAAPSWWTLEDPAGNQADISTVAGRD